VQYIEVVLKFTKENLAIFSFCISLLALIATSINSWNSRRVFLASNYPKITARLYLMDRCTLPIYDIFNESDKIIANDLQIEVSIRSMLDFSVFKGRWFTYTSEKVARLKPLESFLPSGVSGNDLIEWLKNRGYDQKPLSAEKSLKDQKIYSCISPAKSYKIRLNICYTSNVFGANKICRISRKYRLLSCSNLQTTDSNDKSYWKLI
jgi:hypothetical protein